MFKDGGIVAVDLLHCLFSDFGGGVVVVECVYVCVTVVVVVVRVCVCMYVHVMVVVVVVVVCGFFFFPHKENPLHNPETQDLKCIAPD